MLAKIAGGGQVAWATRFAGKFSEKLDALITTPDDNVVFAGSGGIFKIGETVINPNSYVGMFVASVDGDGGYRWHVRCSGDNVLVTSMAHAKDGSLYVAGSYAGKMGYGGPECGGFSLESAKNGPNALQRSFLLKLAPDHSVAMLEDLGLYNDFGFLNSGPRVAVADNGDFVVASRLIAPLTVNQGGNPQLLEPLPAGGLVVLRLAAAGLATGELDLVGGGFAGQRPELHALAMTGDSIHLAGGFSQHLCFGSTVLTAASLDGFFTTLQLTPSN